MLVLTRKIGQQIVIGDGVEVTVLEIRNGVARLGFTAPREIEIHRQEVFERRKEERRLAVLESMAIPAL